MKRKKKYTLEKILNNLVNLHKFHFNHKYKNHRRCKRILPFALTVLMLSTTCFLLPHIESSDSYDVFINIINRPPHMPMNPFPQQNQSDVSLRPNLQVFVSDQDNDTIDVFFYNAFNDQLIGSKKNVTSGNEPSITWPNLARDTSYSWYVIANDSKLENKSETWTFKTKKSTSPPDNNPPPLNQIPIADASASQTVGFVFQEISFDATRSSDTDGIIVNYTWDFGDQKIGYGAQIKHIYTELGEYQVELLVRDNDGAIDEDTFTVVIAQGNLPPTQPIVEGIKMGHRNISYRFMISSIDQDNDTLQYLIDWGDEQHETSAFYPTGQTINKTHHWNSYGIYTISVKAFDNNTESNARKMKIFIDVLPIDEEEIRGLLIDEDSDNIYNLFHNNKTDNITVTKLDNMSYLIDSNNDGEWNYAFHPEKGLIIYYLFLYDKYYKIYQETPDFTFISLFIGMILLILINKWRKDR